MLFMYFIVIFSVTENYSFAQITENVSEMWGSAAEMAEILEETFKKLQNEQLEDDKLSKTRTQDCTFEITFLDRPIEVTTSEIERNNAIVASKEPLFNQTVQRKIETSENIVTIRGYMANLDDSYKLKIEEIQSKLQSKQDAFDAVSRSLEYLKSSEYKAISPDIKSNSDHIEVIPITSNSFLQRDQVTYTRLTDIMEDIRGKLSKSANSSTQLLLSSESNYSSLRKDLEQVKADLTTLYESLEKEELAYAEDLEEARRMIAEVKEERGSMVRAKADKEIECGAWDRQYSGDKTRRLREMATITQTLDKLESLNK